MRPFTAGSPTINSIDLVPCCTATNGQTSATVAVHGSGFGGPPTLQPGSCGSPDKQSIDLKVFDETQGWGIGCVAVTFDAWNDTYIHITYSARDSYGGSDAAGHQYWFHQGDTVTVCVTRPGTTSSSCGVVGTGAGQPYPAGGDYEHIVCQATSNPVNCATGEFWHSFDDLTISGRGMQLHFAHSYSSQQANQYGPLGYGWTESYNLYASLLSSADISPVVTIQLDNGSTESFTSSGGSYTPQPGVLATLAATDGGTTLTFTRGDQTKYVFGIPTATTIGALQKEIDRNGLVTTLTANGSGQLGTVTDPAGRTLTFAYNTDATMSSVTDSSGRMVRFQYNDGQGNLTDVYDANNGHWHYVYDTGYQSLLLQMFDPNQEALPTPIPLTNTYYGVGDAGSTGTGQVHTQTDAVGRTTGFVYATNADGSLTTTITDPKSNVQVENFLNGQLLSITKGFGTAQAATWRYQYDPATFGITQVTDPNNHTVNRTYDARGNLQTAADALARVTVYTYDSFNDLTSQTDPAGVTTTMGYDANGNLISVARPLVALGRTPVPAPTGIPTPPPTASPVALSEPVTLAGGSSPAGLVAGPDGNLWFGEPGTNKVARSSLGGAVSEFSLPIANSSPRSIVVGADGNLWFTEQGSSKIGRITPAGVLTEFPLTAGSAPYGITLGADRNVWFTESGRDRIGRITVGGTVTEYALALGSAPRGIATGADGRLWFAEFGADKIGVLATTGGSASTTALPSGSQPSGIAAGPDGTLWYTEPGTNKIGHIATNGTVRGEFTLAGGSQPQGISTGPDGNVWSTEGGGNKVARLTASGSVTEFTVPTSGSVPAGLAYGPDGNLWLTEQQGNKLCRVALTEMTIFGYDPAHPGDLTSITDPDGHVSHYAYDATAGNLISSSDPLSNTTTMAYDPLGRIISLTSPNGNVAGAVPAAFTTSFSYNPFGDLAQIIDPLLTGQATPGTTSLGYDANRNLISARNANGYTTGYGYDADNERTSVVQPTPTGVPSATPVSDSTTYDGDGNVQGHTDFNGHTVTFTYDPLDRLASAVQRVAQPIPIGTQTRTISFAYDGAGDRTQMTDPLGHVTSYGYDQANERTSSSRLDASGTPVAVTAATYDPDGNVASSIDANNHTSRYTYDSLQRTTALTDPLGRATSFAYDPAGLELLATDANQHSTAYGYDSANRKISVTFADSAGATMGYDASGNLQLYTDANQHSTHYAYDALDRLVTLTDARNKLTQYAYDAVGNRTSVTLPLNPATTYAYDQLNRPISATDPRNPATVYSYDPAGNRTGVTDGLHRLTAYSYDDANELIRVTQPDLTTRGLGYDADGNVISRTDALSKTTTLTYDVLNHPRSTTDPLNRQTGYVYDPVGNLSSLTDAAQPTGRATTYGYDAADQLQSIGYSDGATPNVGFTYTGTGRRASMTDGTGTARYTYDSRDRLLGTANGAGQALSYGYDAAGNMTSLGYPTNGQTVTRTYDELNRLKTVQDWLSHTTTFGYDDNSNLTSIGYPTSNHVAATLGYDTANGLTTIVDSTNPTGTPTPFWTFNYTRDAIEQVSAATDPVQGGVQHTYTRNILDQLVGDQLSGSSTGNTTWSADAAYRLTGRTDSLSNTSSTYTADAANELTNLTSVKGGVTTRNLTLTYNRNGDRTGQSDSVSGASTSYSYDQADRLTSAISGTTTLAAYRYDGDGLRQAKTVGGTASQAAWNMAEGLPLLAQEGSTRYITGPDGLPIEQIDGSGNVRYYLRNQLGSTAGLIDASGTVTDSFRYDPYGQRTAVTGSTADTPFGYAGQYTDAETGLQYLRARYYDPSSGQFLTPDPLAPLTGQPYAYTADNPLNFADPSGACRIDLLGGSLNVPPMDDPRNCSDLVGAEADSLLGQLGNGLADLFNGVTTPAYAPNVDGRPGDLASLRAQAQAQHFGWALPYLSAAYQVYVGDAIDTLCSNAKPGAKVAAAATLIPWLKVLKLLKVGGRGALGWLRWARRGAASERAAKLAAKGALLNKIAN